MFRASFGSSNTKRNLRLKERPAKDDDKIEKEKRRK